MSSLLTAAAAPGVVLGRCNVYGAETGGPKHVLGGMYGPGSARTPGMQLPDNVAQGEWVCERRADVRVRMVCVCGHRGQVMELCSWGEDRVYHGEVVAGVTRQVSEMVRVRGHLQEVQRRQSGSCPACLFPSPYAELAKEIQAWQAQMSQLNAVGLWRTPQAQALRTRVEDACQMMDLARAAGIIHNCPLTLVPVS